MRAFGWLVMGVTVGALSLAGIGCGDDDGDGSGGGGGGTTTNTNTNTNTNTTTTTTTDTGEGGGGGAGGEGGSSAQSYNLRLIGESGYGPHANHMIYMRLQDTESMEVWDFPAVAVDNGSFTIEATGAVMEGRTYTLGYWADVMPNQACDEAPTDHVWQADIPAVTGDVEVTDTHNTNFAACLPAPQ